MKMIVFFAFALFSTSSVMAQQTIDIHCHNILPDFVSFLEKHDAAMEETFPLPRWDVDSHLRFMEETGIQQAVLSMPAPQPYYGNTQECRDIIRRYNEACAQLKSDYPDKFRFCASLPLPDVKAAIEEALYALDSLRADGIKLATNSRGQYVGDPMLDTLMHVLNERHAVVILHPHKPSPANDDIISSTPLAIYEYPAETTRTIINMIAHNIPARYPNIKFVVPHCGSFLPLAIPRMKAIHPAMLAKGLMSPIDWDSNLKNLYYDLAGGATPEVIKSLLSITTPDHLLYGSDYPYQPSQVLASSFQRLQAWLSEDETLAPYTERILSGNALNIFTKNTPSHD